MDIFKPKQILSNLGTPRILEDLLSDILVETPDDVFLFISEWSKLRLRKFEMQKSVAENMIPRTQTPECDR